MSELRDGLSPQNNARRHFLGLAAATTARLGAVGAIAMVHLPGPARAKDGGGRGSEKAHSGHGGGPKCFLKGTRIATERGELEVERLEIGDVVRTARGPSMPVRWIGRKSFKRSGVEWQEAVAPILIRAFALDDESPCRDLYLSPTHRLLIDGVFIEAQHLVNGVSILRAFPDSVTLEYYHLLLDNHEAVFAEGAAAATLQLANDDIECFDNFVDVLRLLREQRPVKMAPYARTLGSGGKEHLKALVRLGVAPVFRLRDPLEEIHTRIAQRGEKLALLSE